MATIKIDASRVTDMHVSVQPSLIIITFTDVKSRDDETLLPLEMLLSHIFDPTMLDDNIAL